MPMEYKEVNGKTYATFKPQNATEESPVFTAVFDAPRESAPRQSKFLPGKTYTTFTLGVADKDGKQVNLNLNFAAVQKFKTKGGKRGTQFFLNASDKGYSMVVTGNIAVPESNTPVAIDVGPLPAFELSAKEKEIAQAFAAIVKSKVLTDDDVLTRIQQNLAKNGCDVAHAHNVFVAAQKA